MAGLLVHLAQETHGRVAQTHQLHCRTTPAQTKHPFTTRLEAYCLHHILKPCSEYIAHDVSQPEVIIFSMCADALRHRNRKIILPTTITMDTHLGVLETPWKPICIIMHTYTHTGLQGQPTTITTPTLVCWARPCFLPMMTLPICPSRCHSCACCLRTQTHCASPRQHGRQTRAETYPCPD